LQTVDTVFVKHQLPKGEMTHRGVRIDPAAIRRVALLTVEGEKQFKLLAEAHHRWIADIFSSVAPSRIDQLVEGLGELRRLLGDKT